MGSIGTTSRHAAFSSDVFPKGLDLRRSKVTEDLGTYVAEAAAVIRQGQFVAYDTNGFIIASAGARTIGVARWNKQNLGNSARVDVPIVLNGTTATFIGRANVSNVSVRSAQNFGGTLFTGGGTDYTLVAAAGTIARVALGAIADGATVFVTFTFALTDADFDFDGREFRNQNNNDVHGQENRIAVITDWARLFTMEYDTAVNYNFAAEQDVYVSAAGIATSTSGTDFAGRVHQLPTAEDPFLGITIHGNPV